MTTHLRAQPVGWELVPVERVHPLSGVGDVEPFAPAWNPVEHHEVVLVPVEYGGEGGIFKWKRQPKSFCVTFGLPFVLIHSPRLMRSASAEESAELQEDDGTSESVDGE